MSIKKLEKEVQSRLIAVTKIKSYKRAVEELVYNSLDSGSSSIAIRINIHDSFIQVVDNGSGISKSDINLLGQIYATSKAVDASVHKSVPNKYYGFRGESLANIIQISKNVKIITRYEKSKGTWIKCFYKGQHKDSYLIGMRPSKGTTVEINGFLYNSHIQTKEINNVTELQSIKIFLQQLSLLKTNISMSLRDNSRNEIIFAVHKNRDIYETLSLLFGINNINLQELQVEKNQYKIKGFVGKNETPPKTCKWIYLNDRFVYKSAIHDIVNENFMKSNAFNKKGRINNDLEGINKVKGEIPYYFIFISCPPHDYDISFNPEMTIVQFKDWNHIKLLIEKFVKFYNGNITLKEVKITKQPEEKLVGNNQEEVRRIFEKILGNKNKTQMISQMQKGVKGKTIRKKVEKKVLHDTQNKKYPKRADGIYKYKLHSSAKALAPQQDSHLNNNIDVAKIEDRHKLMLNKKAQNEKKKIIKNSKRKSDKSNLYIDPIIRKFIKATDSVKRRCDLYSQKVKVLLNQNIIQSPEDISTNINLLRDKTSPDNDMNDVPPNKLRKFSITPNNHNIISEKTNDKIHLSVMPLAKANEGYLKSYDLVKTILNTQKEYSSYIENDALQNKDKSYVNTNIYYRIHDNNFETNIASSHRKLTFDSHQYQKDNVLSKNYNKLNTTNNLYNLRPLNKITKSINKVSNSKFQGILRNRKSYFHFKSREENKGSIIEYIGDQKSNKIDFSNIINNSQSFMGIKNKLCHNGWNYKVTENMHSTFTIIDSNVPINIQSYKNHERETSEVYKKANLEDECSFKALSNIRKEYNTDDLIPWELSNNGSNSKGLFTTYSENLESQIILNSCIEPINVCEGVYKNHATSNQKINEGFNNSGHCKIILQEKTISKLNNINNKFDDNIFDSTSEKGKVSHHFQNVNSSDFHPSIPQSEMNNDKKEKVTEQEALLSKVHDSNEKTFFESFDISFETMPDWIKIVDQNQACNNFKIKNRHNFLPKGMSPIFENCNSKKECSYDLEMDYFTDDLYDEFANKVLDNFELFDTMIKNINDNVSENFVHLNSKFKKDITCLKFYRHSLTGAKVFGQIDKKYIVAELDSESNNTLKYLVLFDQHAVHERIKLEENLSDYIKDDRWISIDCETLSLNLTKENITYLSNFKDKFAQLGLKWTYENDFVFFNAIPKAIFGKHCRQPDVVLRCVKHLIIEEIKAIKSLRGNSLLYPKSMMDLVFSEACRYAIKFGDSLSKDECRMLIKSLSTCRTPFQCAHGRPVMAVLLDMKAVDNEYTVNMSKISMFRNKFIK